MFILIQSRQRNISMWFTVWDQSPIPALNIWNSSSIYLQQTGQDQSRDKKEGPTFLEGSRDSSLRSVSLHPSNKTLYITPTNQRVQWHSHAINTCPCAFLIPFFCFIGICLFVFCFAFLAVIRFSSHVSSLCIYLSSRQWIQDRFSCQGLPLPNEKKWIKHKRSTFKLKIDKKTWRKPISEGKQFFS